MDTRGTLAISGEMDGSFTDEDSNILLLPPLASCRLGRRGEGEGGGRRGEGGSIDTCTYICVWFCGPETHSTHTYVLSHLPIYGYSPQLNCKSCLFWDKHL